MWTLSAIFKMATTVVRIFFGGLKIFCFVTSGLQNIHVDIDIEYICGLEADIKIRDTYHIVGQPFCKVIKILCWINVYKNTLFIINTPENVNLH